MSHALVGNIIVDNSDVVGATPVGAAPTTSSFFIFCLTPGWYGLGKDNRKTRWETFKFWNLVGLILEILRYSAHRGRVTYVLVSNLRHHWLRWWLGACSAPSHYLKNLVHWEHISVKGKFKHTNFYSRKWIWRYRLQNGGYLVWASGSTCWHAIRPRRAMLMSETIFETLDSYRNSRKSLDAWRLFWP